jgi:hypothetical protein
MFIVYSVPIHIIAIDVADFHNNAKSNMKKGASSQRICTKTDPKNIASVE